MNDAMHEQVPEKILIIKLGALGDFIQAFGPMQAIKAHHEDAHITLLTTKPFVGMAQTSGLFDEVIIDERLKAFDLMRWFQFRARLNQAHFTRVYDLQNNDRSNLYFHLFSLPKPEWVGTAKRGSHYNGSEDRAAGRAFDGHVQTLALGGVSDVQIDPLIWMDEDVDALGLRDPYVVFVPGCAPAHPYKRWPAAYYGELARKINAQGYQVVVIGTRDDKDVTDEIALMCPDVLNLNGQTSLGQISALGREAKLAVGNDTGPMHLIAATGTICVSLFSGRTHPERHAPLGEHVHPMQSHDLGDLTVQAVYEMSKMFLH